MDQGTKFNKFPYCDALEKADKAFQEDRVDVGALEKLTGDMLAAQLVSVYDVATGHRKLSPSPGQEPTGTL